MIIASPKQLSVNIIVENRSAISTSGREIRAVFWVNFPIVLPSPLTRINRAIRCRNANSIPDVGACDLVETQTRRRIRRLGKRISYPRSVLPSTSRTISRDVKSDSPEPRQRRSRSRSMADVGIRKRDPRLREREARSTTREPGCALRRDEAGCKRGEEPAG